MEVNGIGQVFERVVEGMRNEMSTVLWRIERSGWVEYQRLSLRRKGSEEQDNVTKVKGQECGGKWHRPSL